MADITYEVKKVIGVISEGKSSKRELRLISWNGREPRYDIRQWGVSEDGTEKCGKGITLTGEQLEKLGKIIAEMAKE